MNCGVIATCASGIAAAIRSEPAPTRIVRPQRSPSAISSETLEAPNRLAVVSAICCNERAASPPVLAMARRISALAGVEPLVRKDVPNILLSHNPNSFNRAAELGIELSLAGHTHGGQIQVEILDHRLSPARFITDYVAGLYMRPLFTPAKTVASQKFLHATTLHGPHSAIYVNRGLGTVGAPVRLGVPPEISLLTLRRG